MGPIYRTIFACALFLGFTTELQAKLRSDLSQEFTGDRYSSWSEPAAPQKYVVKKARKTYRTVKRTVGTIAGYARHLGRNPTRDLSGYPEPLIAKARELESACGSKIISAYRPDSRVAGSGRQSLHAVRKAVDMQGNPACMRSHLVGWRGGASTDYARMQHIHISYEPGGREWGARFVHGGGSKRVRFASRRHRYAVAQ